MTRKKKPLTLADIIGESDGTVIHAPTEKAQIIIHYGGMSSGKSVALIEEHEALESVGDIPLVYVPSPRKRRCQLTSRFLRGSEKPAKGVRNSIEIYQNVTDHLKKIYTFNRKHGGVVSRLRITALIDEIQLFDDSIKEVIEHLSYYGVRVVGAGVDLDFRGEPFPLKGERKITMPEIMGIASQMIPHYARCSYVMDDGAPCGSKATHSQRFRDVEQKEPSHYGDPTIETDKRKYLPVCVKHHVVPGKFRELWV